MAAPRHGRYFALDLWRGVACLLVVTYHSTLVYRAVTPGYASSGGLAPRLLWLSSHLNVGVQLFFVISGYCIAASADSALRSGHSVRLFFWRRFRRIYPPLWTVIVCLAVFYVLVDYFISPGLLPGPPWDQAPIWQCTWTQWLGNLTLTETWLPRFVGGERLGFPGQNWTLCYEEQFYAITGLLLLISKNNFFKGALAVTAACPVVLVLFHHFGLSAKWFFFDGNWLLFASGIAVYYCVRYASRWQYLGLCGLTVVASIGAAAVSQVHWAIGFAFAFLLTVIHPLDAAITGRGAAQPLIACGRMCYSLYLVHQIPVKVVSSLLYAHGIDTGAGTLLITTPACIAISLAAGVAFYLGVERRFLNAPVPAVVPTTAEAQLALVRVDAKR